MATPNSDLTMQITPSQPEATNVYDSHHGRHHDPVCDVTIPATPQPLPGTPSPFSNLK